jgi:hypothetical protein
MRGENVSPLSNWDDPEWWWRRARQTRAQIARQANPEHKQAMTLVAEAYERRAGQAEAWLELRHAIKLIPST